MNTTEKIVEAYFRICKNCLTIPDIKVIRGNNRQLDLLAYHLPGRIQYHVEVSVTHGKRWCPTPNRLCEMFDRKFFGIPQKREGKNTDWSKGKTYKESIYNTYSKYGFSPERVNRVWVSWTINEPESLDKKLKDYAKEHGIAANPISVVSFRDQIIPELLEVVSTAHYENDTLRTFSLLRQYQAQTREQK